MTLITEEFLTRPNGQKNLHETITSLIEAGRTHLTPNPRQALQEACEAIALCEQTGSDELVAALFIAGYAQFNLFEYTDSLIYLERALAIATERGDRKQIVQAQRYIGMSYVRLGKKAEALLLFQEASIVFEELGLWEELIPTYRTLGGLYDNFSQYTKAIEYYERTLELLKLYPNKQEEAKTLSQIATTHGWRSDYDAALAAFEQLLPICLEIGYQTGYAIALGNIGTINLKLKNYPLAIEYFSRSIDAASNNSEHICMALTNIADSYSGMGEHRTAHEYIERALQLLDRTTSRETRPMVLTQYGEILVCLGDYHGAIAKLEQVLTEFPDLWSAIVLTQVYKHLYRAYEGLGEFRTALEYFKKYNEVNEEQVRQQMQNEILMFKTNQEIKKKEAEKEAYRLKSIRLEEELQSKVKSVTKLGLEVIDKNEFLTSMKKRVQEIIPHSNGSERALRSFVREIDEKIVSSDVQQRFDTALKQLHEDFLTTLTEQYPDLTATEKKVCSLIKLGLNSHQIADLLFTSIRTVEGHRLKIRKKLLIPVQTDIQIFLDHLPLAEILAK